SGLTALLLPDGGLDDVAEMGGEQTDPHAQHRHGPGELGVVDDRVDGRQQPHDGRRQDQQSQPHHPPRPQGAPQRGGRQGRHEHGHGHRQQTQPGLERVEALYRLQIQRDREEQTQQNEILAEQRHQTGPQHGPAQQRQVHQRVDTSALPPPLPGPEYGQDDRPGTDDEQGRSEAQDGERRIARLHPPPGAALQHPEHAQPQPDGGQDRPHAVQPRPCARRGGRRDHPAHSSTATTTTTSPAKTNRQVRYVVTQPPSNGPTAIPAPASPPMTAYATARSRPRYASATSAAMAGSTIAAPSPSITDQPRVSTHKEGATAVRADPTP